VPLLLAGEALYRATFALCRAHCPAIRRYALNHRTRDVVDAVAEATRERLRKVNVAQLAGG
jgi:hypothetical protein